MLVRRAPWNAIDPDLTFLLHELGRSDEQLVFLEEEATGVSLARACRLWAMGEIRGAAEVFAAHERNPMGEAFARLAAGRQFASEGRHAEADVELLRAIELYRPLGARRYLDEAEALLSAAAATAQPG